MKPPICPGPCNNCNRTAIRSRNPETGDMEWTPVVDWLCPICADPTPARALPSELEQRAASNIIDRNTRHESIEGRLSRELFLILRCGAA